MVESAWSSNQSGEERFCTAGQLKSVRRRPLSALLASSSQSGEDRFRISGQPRPEVLHQRAHDGLAIADPRLIVHRMGGTDRASTGIGSSVFRTSCAGACGLHNQTEEE